MPGCADAQSTTTETNLDITGDSLPAIRHVTEMKISGDTLLFAYESNDGYGQRFLRRAFIDFGSNQLKTSPDVGKRDDGYYVSFMPYPVIADNGTIRVISQDDGEIYSIENDTSLVRTKHYLMDGNSTVPFPLSRYVKDIFMSDSDQYVFMGREPNGGRQFAMAADLTSSKQHITRIADMDAKYRGDGLLAQASPPGFCLPAASGNRDISIGWFRTHKRRSRQAHIRPRYT